MNKEEKALVKFLEREWGIINGLVRGNEEGEYTFIGESGNTVIDYVIEYEEVRERIKRLEVGEGVESDHHPVIVIIEGEGQKWGKGEGRRRRAHSEEE